MPGNKVALGLALICALIASIIVYRIMKQNDQPQVVEVPKVPVVYAKATIPARTVISAEQLEIRQIPEDAVIPDSYSKIDELVGLVTKAEIVQGEPINKNRVLQKGQTMGLSFVIPPGKRAITISINEVIGVAGFVKPGERVDLIGTIEPKDSGSGSVSWTVIQDVEVLAVAQEMGEPVKDEKKDAKKTEPKLATSVTLAVTPLQAQKIALAEEKGVLRLTLRPLLREEELNLLPVSESNLIPGRPTPPRPATPAEPQPQIPKRTIEVISGGKSQIITVN
ncbi:MAG TPA: Flp pilus assembly protein CpaB [Bacillota bacterium]|jgi:pilus assembly protein CpaB|nr:Flp pilus assembly protein CpaB [Bacillota bacterium]HOL10395.1 Flp pilus assembly protein CpaB [Bacillota bacterium]HPO97448.1 Flp pilus assembly protein CpaB [Bacillota bacterium]